MTERKTLPAAEFPLCMRHLLQPVWGDGAVSRKGLPGEVGLQSFSPFTSLAFLQLEQATSPFQFLRLGYMFINFFNWKFWERILGKKKENKVRTHPFIIDLHFKSSKPI